MKKEGNKRLGTAFMCAGFFFILAACGFALANYQTEQNAAKISESVAVAFLQAVETEPDEAVTPATDGEIDEAIAQVSFTLDGNVYLGVLSIPQLEKTLPVQTSWSYDALTQTPCVYSGSIAEGDLVIAGHNYVSHFTGLRTLQVGDEITLQTADGQVYTYSLVEMEIIDGSAVEQLLAGEWELTLFTCYTDNSQRVVARFVLI